MVSLAAQLLVSWSHRGRVRSEAAFAALAGAAPLELAGEDMRFTMPPQPTLIEGPQAFVRFMAQTAFGPDSPGQFKLIGTRANGRLAAANYVRAPGDDAFRAMSLDVLRTDHGRLVEVTTFEARLFEAFGLPVRL